MSDRRLFFPWSFLARRRGVPPIMRRRTVADALEREDCTTHPDTPTADVNVHITNIPGIGDEDWPYGPVVTGHPVQVNSRTIYEIEASDILAVAIYNEFCGRDWNPDGILGPDWEDDD